MKATRHDYLYAPDGTPHVIDENGRTCTTDGAYHPWEDYYTKPGTLTGYEASCKNHRNAASKERRDNRKADKSSTNINSFLQGGFI